ncbi:MAG: family 10 glycosylhydrolase [Candidatus Marinimicrobia bacterium]|nr:family 10 glycosylhydrolase [Candidatus Neomarinimicrobiota bacterium]
MPGSTPFEPVGPVAATIAPTFLKKIRSGSWSYEYPASLAKGFSLSIYWEEQQFQVHSGERGSGDVKLLDPGISAVRTYLKNVVMDVVNNYNIEGIHFDDYFYPYPDSDGNKATISDSSAWANDKRGYSSNSADWRRNNVDIFIDSVNTAIKAAKPYVKFSVSPFGIYKNGTPSGTSGMDAYSVIYADPVQWLVDGSVDFLVPQLYWPHDGNQDYTTLLNWWSTQANNNNRHLYAGGTLLYRSWVPEWHSVSEVHEQIDDNRSESNCQGNVTFRTEHAINYANDHSDVYRTLFTDTLYTDLALPPPLTWLDNTDPTDPQNLSESTSGSDHTLTWSAPTSGAHRYVIYRDTSQPIDKTNAANILAIAYGLTYADASAPSNALYAVSALDQAGNESDIVHFSNGVLSLTFEDDSDVSNWGYHNGSNAYTTASHASSAGVDGTGAIEFGDGGWSFLIKRPITFTSGKGFILTVDVKTSGWDADHDLFLKIEGLVATPVTKTINTYTNFTSVSLTGTATSGSGYIAIEGSRGATVSNTVWLDNLELYERDSSLPVSLSTFKATQARDAVTLSWTTESEVDNLGFNIYRSNSKTEGFSLINESLIPGAGSSTVAKDYSFVDNRVSPGEIYFYQLEDVSFNNTCKKHPVIQIMINAEEVLLPGTPHLFKAFPNPFNPATNIGFSIPEKSSVSLTVFNLQGIEVANLIHQKMNAGFHEVIFEAKNLPSGIYIYRLQTSTFSQTRHMLLLK